MWSGRSGKDYGGPFYHPLGLSRRMNQRMAVGGDYVAADAT